MKKGRIIVIEGASDGIGKTTQFNLLKEKLEKECKVFTHHFPSYNEKEAILVEEYLKGNLGNKNDLSPYLVHDLYAIDRAITWVKTLKEKYDEGYTILLDRYTTSSIFYQTVFLENEEKKDFINFIEDYEYNKLGIKRPDIVIFLTAPYEVIKNYRKNRQNNEGIENDIHEKDNEYMLKVYENGCYISKILNWDIVDCSNGNLFKYKEEIADEIYNLIKKI